MTPLNAITGLSPEAADLLAAAGISSAERLAGEDPQQLHRRLEVLSWQRGRSHQTPQPDLVEHWVAVARMMTPMEAVTVSMEEIPEAVALPSGPGAWMAPAVRAAAEATGAARPETEPAAVRQESAAAENAWRKVDPNSFATIEDYNEGRLSVQPLSRESLTSAPADADGSGAGESPVRRTQRIRSNGEKLSRWVRRGVVHPRPLHTWLGAVVSLAWRAAFLTGVVAFIWLITSSRQPSAHTDKVIAAAVVLLVLGCMQLHFAGRSRCRICSCNLFYSKNCHKNKKAHLIPGLGYVASAALHLLTFGWFRCMYCGTAVRLRPGRDR